jgi:membrane protein implicated in regulation of membrane protease activity
MDMAVVWAMALGGFELGLAFLIIGLLMLLAEVSSPGYFILVPATVLLVLGTMYMLAPELLDEGAWWPPLLAGVVAIPATYISIKMYQRLAPPAPPETTVASSLIGQIGVVEVEVVPNSLKGKVRIDHDTWSATSGSSISVGKRIKVVASEGVHVTVEEVQ